MVHPPRPAVRSAASRSAHGGRAGYIGRRQARRLPPLARSRLFRVAESVGRRQCADAAGHGLQGPRITSSGYAWSQGLPDGGASREAVLAHLRTLVDATDLPVNADFESGYAADPEGVAVSVRMAVETGVAGLSIEDYRQHRRSGAQHRRSRRQASRSTRGDRRSRRRHAAGRARRKLPVWTYGPRRHHRTAQGLRRSRGGLPLCAGHPHAGADHSGGGCGGAQAGQPADRLRE